MLRAISLPLSDTHMHSFCTTCKCIFDHRGKRPLPSVRRPPHPRCPVESLDSRPVQVRPISTNVYYDVTFEITVVCMYCLCYSTPTHIIPQVAGALSGPCILQCKGPDVRRSTHMHTCSPAVKLFYATVIHERLGWMGMTPVSLLYVCM